MASPTGLLDPGDRRVIEARRVHVVDLANDLRHPKPRKSVTSDASRIASSEPVKMRQITRECKIRD
jgi:hypothetical protein